MLYVKDLLTIFARSRESFGALPSLNSAKSYSFPQPILCPANHTLISLSAVQESLLILSIWYTKFSLFSDWYRKFALMSHVKAKITTKIKIETSGFIPIFLLHVQLIVEPQMLWKLQDVDYASLTLYMVNNPFYRLSQHRVFLPIVLRETRTFCQTHAFLLLRIKGFSPQSQQSRRH